MGVEFFTHNCPYPAVSELASPVDDSNILSPVPSYNKPDSQFKPVEPVEVTILLSVAFVKVNPSMTVLEP